jgi:hypothetical protein
LRPPVPFFFAFHVQESACALEVRFVLPTGVPRILPASRLVSSLHEPFGAVVRADAGVAASATPAASAVAATMRIFLVLMGRGA